MHETLGPSPRLAMAPRAPRAPREPREPREPRDPWEPREPRVPCSLGPPAARQRAGDCAAPVAIACYMAASVGMVVANKRAVGSLHAGTVLLAVQQLFTCAAVLAMSFFRVVALEGSWPDALRWSPTGMLSGLVLWAGMQAVKRASLATLTVVRNASPLFLLVAEWLAFGHRPTTGKVASLVVILVGVCVYTWDDMQDSSFDPMGIFFILLDAFLVCIDSLLERYLLALNPVDLSTPSCVLVTNSVGLIPVALLLLGPCSDEWSELEIDSSGMIWGLLTLPLGVAMAFVGISLRRVVSATAAVVVANVDKVVVLLYGVLFMGDGLDTWKGVGCAFALAGGAWHAVARRSAPDEGPSTEPMVQFQGAL